jgi:predicted permease
LAEIFSVGRDFGLEIGSSLPPGSISTAGTVRDYEFVANANLRGPSDHLSGDMTLIRQHVREAARLIRREPGFAALAVMTLALGIGANTAMFSVIRTVLLDPLPYGDAERLVMIWNASDRQATTWLSRQEVTSYGRDAKTLESFAAYTEADANLTDGNDPERVRAAQVTAELFSVLRVQPLLGRTFSAADAVQGADDGVVLGHGLWTRRFGADPGIVGRQIQVNGRARTVVGVMPAGFKLPMDYQRDRPTELWQPFVMDPANLGGWGDRLLMGVGRLRPDVTHDTATSEFHVLWRRWIDAGYIADQRDTRGNRAAIPVRELVTGDVRMPLMILLGTVGFVLLIALANVANLWLSKAAARSRDFAVRAALGADRARLVMQMLVESIILAALGGVFGLALAFALVRLLAGMHAGTLPRIEDATVDPPLLLFTVVVSLVAGLLFGLAPALQLSRPALNCILNESSRGATSGRARQRLRQALVVGQMTLSVVLALGAGLLTRSLIELYRVPLGYDTSNVLTAQVQLPPANYPQPSDVIRFFRQLDERLGELPGVREAGFVRILPLSRTIGNWSITLDSRPYSAEENPNGDFQWATAGYLEAMGVRPIRGRLIAAGDTEDSQLVVVINETMAQRYWPGEDAIGRRFHFGTLDQPWLTIVGIVPSVRHNEVVEEPRAEMYVPHPQVSRARAGTPRSMAVVMKTESDPRGLIPGLREAARALDPNLPIADIRMMQDVEARALAEPRLTTWLLGGFAGLALLLAAVGIYGTVALFVADRSQEIGIRLALGAQRPAILRMILSQGVSLAVVGIALGVTAAFFLMELLESVLYGVTTMDPVTFVIAPLLLGGVAVFASLSPAHRASRLDPVQTLKR